MTLTDAIFITRVTAAKCACGHAARQADIVRVPLYSDYCDCCQATSAPFDVWATCTECADRFCPACSATAHVHEEDGSTTLCLACVDAGPWDTLSDTKGN